MLGRSGVPECLVWALLVGWIGVNAMLFVGSRLLADVGWDRVYAADRFPVQRASAALLQAYWDCVVVRNPDGS